MLAEVPIATAPSGVAAQMLIDWGIQNVILPTRELRAATELETLRGHTGEERTLPIARPALANAQGQS